MVLRNIQYDIQHLQSYHFTDKTVSTDDYYERLYTSTFFTHDKTYRVRTRYLERLDMMASVTHLLFVDDDCIRNEISIPITDDNREIESRSRAYHDNMVESFLKQVGLLETPFSL